MLLYSAANTKTAVMKAVNLKHARVFLTYFHPAWGYSVQKDLKTHNCFRKY